jgi:hypothetical protein
MVVLATKLYVAGDARERVLDSLQSLIGNELADLDVAVDIGVRDDDFPSVTVSGADETIARNLLREAFGELVPDLQPGEQYTGTLQRWTDEAFILDVGFGNAVEIPVEATGLGQGTGSQIRTRFGLVQHMPLDFVYSEPDGADGEASRLTDDERDRLYEWTRGPGRVNVNSATRAEVRATVNRAGHANDIVTVERQGLLEQSIICREATDPPGLLAEIGQHLQAELLCVVP